MSAIGRKQTSLVAPHRSAFGTAKYGNRHSRFTGLNIVRGSTCPYHRLGHCLRASVAERPVVLPPAKRRGVLKNDGKRFEHGLQKCLSKAAHARTPELKELWQTMAESYRFLLESNRYEITYQSWLRNNAPRQTE